MGDISSIEPVKSLTLELPPSCIEFWPSNEQFAIVGTYNLEKGEDKQKGNVAAAEVPKVQERNGSLILLHVQNDDAYVLLPSLPATSIDQDERQYGCLVA
jgi:diphthamide biosynthesis protein 7